MSDKYELTFSGSAPVKGFPRYKRWHPSYEAAHDEAMRVLSLAENRAAHPGMIYLGDKQVGASIA